MRNVTLDLAVTLDGFIEGPNGEIDWCIMDDDMDFGAFLDSIDTIFYGRVSYDMWGNYIPDENASPLEKSVWLAVHAKEKVVFSSQERHDQRATFINQDITKNVTSFKNKPGKDIWLYGGSKLITTFIDFDLIDVYRLSVHPTVLGSGKPLFSNLKRRLNLNLLHTRRFKSGVVQLVYTR